MGGVNLPTTSPLWLEQRIADGVDLTSQEQKISEQQTELLVKTREILDQPVAKGDMRAARERVNELKKEFEALSPAMKDYLYNVLQTDTGGRGDLARLFHYKLSSPSRDTLLKSLNPNHKVEHIEKETINSAVAKMTKAAEKDLEGMSQMHKLRTQVDKNSAARTNDFEMTDTAYQQGFMAHSTKEISESKKNEHEISVEDRPHVKREGNKLVIVIP